MRDKNKSIDKGVLEPREVVEVEMLGEEEVSKTYLLW